MKTSSDSDKILREELTFQLGKGHAHMSLSDAVKDFPMKAINTKFPNGTYSAWDLLEHIRRTQNDILDFITDPNYKDRNWPEDYWPKTKEKATPEKWKKTILGFNYDNKKLQNIAKDPKTDLFTKIPNGTAQTILREIIVVVDHNSYHTGEFTIIRQAMGTWK